VRREILAIFSMRHSWAYLQLKFLKILLLVLISEKLYSNNSNTSRDPVVMAHRMVTSTCVVY